MFVLIAALALGAGVFGLLGPALAAPVRRLAGQQEATPDPSRIATDEELAAAAAEWERSAHADTYDNGLGANTTCARCKSPLNWDESAPGAEAALDCASCKRIAGQPRPELTGGIAVPESEWHDIGCEVCHEPAGDSFYTGVAFWNNAAQMYEPVESTMELCAHCHEGRHGFEVVEEQAVSPAHNNWECTACHGAHGEPAECESCHDPATGAGLVDHARHPGVNCTACHDAGRLTISLELDESSAFYGDYVPIRYAHTLTSWPSHNLQKEVDCTRCHHRRASDRPAVAVEVGCNAAGCHVNGAVLNWCPIFAQDPPPEGLSTP